MCKKIFYILLWPTFFRTLVGVEDAGSSWITFMKQIKIRLNYCLATSSNSKWSCFKDATLKGFDDIMTKDVIPLTNGIRLVRDPFISKPRNGPLNKRFDRWVRSYATDSWPNKVLMKFMKILDSHVLQIDGGKNGIESEAKGPHRRRNQMLPAMMFGITALGMVIVPIGFQFLAVVSGKALLLAKLALILASINGLKRIATSGVNFGLYQVPAERYQYYDRDDVNPPQYKEP